MPTLRSTIACRDDDGNHWEIDQIVSDSGLEFEIRAPGENPRHLTPVAPVFKDAYPHRFVRSDEDQPLPLD